MGMTSMTRRGIVGRGVRVALAVVCALGIVLALRMAFPPRVAHPDYLVALMALSSSVMPQSEASRRNAETLREAAEMMTKIHRESIAGFSWEERKKLPGRSAPIYRLLDVSEEEVGALAEPERLQHRLLALTRAMYVERISPLFEGLRVRDPVAPMLVAPDDPRGSLVDVVMLAGQEFQSIAEWEALLAYEAIGSGDTERALAHLQRLGWMVRATHGAPSILGRLIGNGAELLALQVVMDQLGDGNIDGGNARAFLEALQEIEGSDPGFLPLIEGERLTALSIVERAFAGDERVQEFFSENAFPSRLFGRIFPVERRVCDRVEEYFDRLRDPVLQRDIAAIRAIQSEFDESRSWQDVIAYEVTPAMGAWMERQVLLEHLREAAATMLAIEVYRAERGRLPDRLEDLMPQFVRVPARDLLAGDGSSVRYRVLEEGEDAPVEGGYVLWSVGPNGRDDGGVMRVESLVQARQWEGEEGVAQLLQAAQRGGEWDGDIVLNLSRARLWTMMREAGWTPPVRFEKPVLIDLGS